MFTQTDRRWLMVLLVVLAMPLVATLGLAVSGLTIDALGGAETCLSRVTFGVPCPLCGGTSSWVAMWHGQVGGAFALNPFATALFFVFAASVVAGTISLVKNSSPWPRLARVHWWPVGAFTGAALLASWAWTLGGI